ncbi:OLC1v1005044C1 [Oldenlandia corymbosa var. corymbosa]|uniref:OLC1v1005044C1 n=1 Tax=Oldenlandia corymbosa var. corymbosa TaxID=529605 RepID=A0AAV1DFQ5_OLDCO|nr:OLC1v1005044C1 [Oldenlandia corymbosa var. corymbosa]
MVAHAALVHLKNLLHEEVLPFLAEVLAAEKGMVAKFLEFINDLNDEFGSLKDVSSSYLPIIKQRLQKVVRQSPCEKSYIDYVKNGRSESIMHDLDGIQSILEEFINEIDGGAEQVAISLCDTVIDDLLLKIKYVDNHEVVNRIKIAADMAADAIEDFLANTPFLLGTNHFFQVQNISDLLNDIDQMLSHPSEEATSSSVVSPKDEAFCSQERNMENHMFVDTAPLLPQEFQERPFLRELDDDSAKLQSSQDFQVANMHPTHVGCEKEKEKDIGLVAFPMSTSISETA